MEYPFKLAFPQGSRVRVKNWAWFRVPQEPAIVYAASWSVDFGNWSCRCDWPCGKVVWFIQTDLEHA